MRRSWKVLLVVALALALIALLISAASAAMSRTNAKTLRYTADIINCESVESNVKDAPGDGLVCADRLLVDDKEVGRLGQVCTVLLAEKPPRFETAQFLCMQSVELADGQVNGQGLLLPAIHPEEFRYGITGGTGAYKGAVGYGTITDNGGTLTLHLEHLAG
jgi:hypothetical protein